jgi:putative peptide zinc metalloprotease protein
VETANLIDLQEFEKRQVLHTSNKKPTYLLVHPNGKYISVSFGAYHLLQQVASGVTFSALAENISQQSGDAVTEAEVKTAYEHIVDQIIKIRNSPEVDQFGFWLRFPLIPESLVAKIASWLSIAFSPMVGGVILACTVFLFIAAGTHQFSFDFMPGSFLAAYLLFLFSILCHEFGHASACARYNARPSEIGFTMYMTFPALYSNVTSAWQLKRQERIVVDLGGVFFQLVLGALYAAAYAVFGWEPLKIATLFIIGSCLFALNPVLKFDGYWVVADALGVTNLARQRNRIMRHFLNRLRGQLVDPLPWPLHTIVLLFVYSLFSFTVWAYFCWKFLPIAINLFISYPALLVTVATELSQPWVAFDSNLFQSFLVSTFFVIFLVTMVVRLAIIIRR